MEVLDVVIDTDPGCDDAMAILLALLSARIRVQCITVTYGNTTLANCTRNLELILNVAHLNHVKVQLPAQWQPVTIAAGADRPLVYEATYAHFYHGDDGLGGIHATIAAASGYPRDMLYGRDERVFVHSERHAADELLHQLQASSKRVVIVALGPLTNIALAWQKDPALMAAKSTVFSMGGAIGVPGNVTPVAEFNVWTDPHAAEVVYDATSHPDHPLQLVLFPTNATQQPIVYRDDYSGLVGKEFMDHPAFYFIHQAFQHTFRVEGEALGQKGSMIHDAVVTHYLLDHVVHSEQELHELGYRFEEKDVRVETGGRWTRGMLVVDERGYDPTDPAELLLLNPESSSWEARRPNRVRCLMAIDASRCAKHVILAFGAA